MKTDRFIWIVPTKGQHVVDPDDSFKRVPLEGKRARASTYWTQVIADGAASEGSELKPATKASKADS